MNGCPLVVIIITIVSLIILFLCLLLFKKKQEFNGPMLGLLTLIAVLILTAIINPKKFKYGDLEIHAQIKKAKELEKDLQKAINITQAEINRAIVPLSMYLRANRSAKYVLESSAIAMWNSTYSRDKEYNGTKDADKIFVKLYGSKAEEYKSYLKSQGILTAPVPARRMREDTKPPTEIDSPLIDKLIHGSKNGRKNKN